MFLRTDLKTLFMSSRKSSCILVYNLASSSARALAKLLQRRENPWAFLREPRIISFLEGISALFLLKRDSLFAIPRRVAPRTAFQVNSCPTEGDFQQYSCTEMDYIGEESKRRKLSDDSNGSASVLSESELKMLLEPLSKEQLVALLVDAGSQYPAIAEDIRDVASKDPAHRKLFVRGLAWETSSQALRDVFEQYGEIEEGAVIVDKATGKSRGFGFITFKHMDSAHRAIKEPSKTIDGRITVCNLAAVGTNSPAAAVDQAQRKLYIGGLSYDTSSETLIKIFSQYGEIEEGSVAYDKSTNKSRGFAFVTFKNVEAARKAIEDPNKNIEGRSVMVKLAIDGQKDKVSSQATTPSVQVVSHVQPGYSVNPSLTSYPRPQMQTAAGSSIGFAGYPPNLAAAYTGQPAYTGLPGPQYGAVAAGGQYGSAQYAQFGGGYANAQAVQPGLHSGSIPAGGALPAYYGGAP